ncbi:MAG TPA: ABC transporter permease, partial [Pirellulaceae bacterium]
MRSILDLAAKDLRLILRDKMGLFFIVAFPVIMGVLFGLMGRNMSSEEESTSIELALVDEDDSEMSRRFVEKLQKNRGIRIDRVPLLKAEEDVRKRRLAALVVIPKG